MLDSAACMKLIDAHGVSELSRYEQQLAAACALWPTVSRSLDPLKRAPDTVQSYTLAGIDGSQIYPDRHEGFSDYLINVGTALFNYDTVSSAELMTQPFIFSGLIDGRLATAEYINAQRTLYELEQACRIVTHKVNKPLIFFDGALLFWHLSTPQLHEQFLARSLDQLQMMYHARGVYMGYISASHSRDLIALFEDAAQSVDLGMKEFDYLVDADLLAHFLNPGDYTQLFPSRAWPCQLYPDFLKPAFFYLHTGAEIARVELPAYCAADAQLVAALAAIVMDQCRKGNGYPVALAEAHELAVITAADRDFFYTMLRMRTPLSKRSVSQKLVKKRTAVL